MSTKEIRKALDRLSEEHGEGAVRAAMRALEAIERAARTYTKVDDGRLSECTQEELEHFHECFLRVAKGAP